MAFVSVSSFCVTNYPKCRGLKHYYLTVSVGQESGVSQDCTLRCQPAPQLPPVVAGVGPLHAHHMAAGKPQFLSTRAADLPHCQALSVLDKVHASFFPFRFRMMELLFNLMNIMFVSLSFSVALI